MESGMSTRASVPNFVCVECGSASVAIDGPFNDLAPVTCDECGCYLGPWDIFVDEMQRRLVRQGVLSVAEDAELRRWRERPVLESSRAGGGDGSAAAPTPLLCV
jgi:hypothetical protein